MAITEIRAESLEGLIKEAEKLPHKPTGTVCNLFRASKPSNGGDGYSYTIKLKHDLFVQCFGECKEKGRICEPVVEFIRNSEDPPELSFLRIKCLCKEPRTGKIHVE
jgi:hypothetical protein